MIFLENKDDNNHHATIKELVKKSDKVVIVSPFIRDIITEIISLNKKLKEVIIITNLDKKYNDSATKVLILYDLMAKFKNTEITVRNDKKLHGKIYSFSKGTKMLGTIVTSANATQGGLVNNNEYGILIEEQETQEKIVTSVLNKPYEDISFSILNLLHQRAKEYVKNYDFKKESGFNIHDYIDEPIEDPEKHPNKKSLSDQLADEKVPEEIKEGYYKVQQALNNLLIPSKNSHVYSRRRFSYHVYKLEGKKKNTNIVAISANSKWVYLGLDVDPETIPERPGEIIHKKNPNTGKTMSSWGTVKFIIMNSETKTLNSKLLGEALGYVEKIYKEKLSSINM